MRDRGLTGIKKDSHAYIIASPSAEKREEMAAELACSFVCSSRDISPCHKCTSCKNALAGVHPDVIDISRRTDDKGKTKRDIQVEQIRHMAADAYVRPQIADKKVYIIRDAGFMNDAAQNAALKILEEPPKYAVFILCADSAEMLLATIRSRCVIIRCEAEIQEKESELAKEYLTLAVKKKASELCRYFSKCETLDNEQAESLIREIRFCLNNSISMKKSFEGLSRGEAFRLLSLCDRSEEYMRLNVNVKHVMGMLCVLTI
jgi:DNA polymerase III delta prime subunit